MEEIPLKLAWYQSRVIVGALVALVFLLLDRFNVAHGFLPEHQAALVDLFLLIGGTAGAGVAVHARVTQQYVPPIGASTIKRAVAWPLLLLLGAALLAGCTTTSARLERAGKLTVAACNGIIADAPERVDDVGRFCRRLVALAPAIGVVAAAVQAAAEVALEEAATVPTEP